jgi:anthranilate phosphoribosyltransferase
VYSIAPEDFGIARHPIDSLRVQSPAESLAIVLRVLGGEAGPASDFVALNAGAALYAADCADTLADGIAAAREILTTGRALERMQQYVALTHRL